MITFSAKELQQGSDRAALWIRKEHLKYCIRQKEAEIEMMKVELEKLLEKCED